jgi:hypothetical protein
MGLLSDEVMVGDRFIKVRDYTRTVYEVDSIVASPGTPPHARPVAARGSRSEMLISTSALSDARFWSRVSSDSD